MKMKISLASAAFLAASTLIPSAGATILIDDFSELQVLVQRSSDPDFLSSSVSGAGILGDERDISVSRTGVPFSSKIVIGDGSAITSISNAPGSDADFTIQWDGLDGSIGNAGLLGGIDLTTDGVFDQIGVAIDLLRADLASVFTLRIGSQDGAVSAASTMINSAVTSARTLNFLFADMIGSANFSDVSFVELSIGGDVSFDLAFAGIGTIDGPPSSSGQVPEPAPALLLLFGLGAIGLKRFKRS